MTTTYTSNLALALQGTGDNNNSWGTALNANVFTFIDQVLGTKLSLSVAGSSNVTLSTAQSQNLYFNFTGALTGNINVIFPASAGRIIAVNNATSGSFTLSVIPSGGTALLIPQGTSMIVLMDGATNTALNVGNIPVNYEVSLASATTTDLGSVGSNLVSVTGTTTITALGSSALATNAIYFVRFTGILTLTHNGTSLILPGAASITTAAGDTAIFKYEGSGNWRCLNYVVSANGPSTFSPSSTSTLTNKTYDTAGTGNVFKINGTAVSAITGSGSVALATSPTFVTPTLGAAVATTPAALDSSTKVATTAFVNPASSIGSSGYAKLANGLYLQWGSFTTNSSGFTNLTFPIAFPTALFSITASNTGSSNTNSSSPIFNTASATTTTVPCSSVHDLNGSFATSAISWFAIGN